jgi:hypothetical protein
MTEEKDRYRAPAATKTARLAAIPAGGSGQKADPTDKFTEFLHGCRDPVKMSTGRLVVISDVIWAATCHLLCGVAGLGRLAALRFIGCAQDARSGRSSATTRSVFAPAVAPSLRAHPPSCRSRLSAPRR